MRIVSSSLNRSLQRIRRALGSPAHRCQSEATDRWDHEWIFYLNNEDPSPFLRPSQSLIVERDLKNLSAPEVYAARLCPNMPPLGICMPGSALVGGRVLEVGCGPGLLSKQLGLIAAQVVGIDYSRFALYLARLVSPNTCLYYHTSDTTSLKSLAGALDCMVCRNFFIHQNYDNAITVLSLARRLLCRGGRIGADFYRSMPEDLNEPQGVVIRAKSALSADHPSCGFEFTLDEIRELADAAGFRITDTWEPPGVRVRFVTLTKR